MRAVVGSSLGCDRKDQPWGYPWQGLGQLWVWRSKVDEDSVLVLVGWFVYGRDKPRLKGKRYNEEINNRY